MARTKETTIEFATLHAQQEHIKSHATRYNVLACGRRWGKSFLAEDLTEPLIDGYPVGYFTPTYKLLTEFWEACVKLYAPIIKRKDDNQRRIELYTGGVLEMWTLKDKDAGRSRKYKRVIIDEAGLCPVLKTAWMEAIRATLADYRGDAWFMGTPKGRNGFYEFYMRGVDPLQGRWSSWQLATHTNPHIQPDELDELREEMTERAYQQEILAEFLEDGGIVFRGVTAASTLTPQPGPIDGHEYVFGVDWARSNDYTVISIIDATTSQQVAQDRFSGVGYELQYGRLIGLLDHWKPVQSIAEYNSMGGPMVERLQGAGYNVTGFVTTNASKAKLIDELALSIEQGRVKLLNDDIQQFELMAYDYTTLPSGLICYSAPEDDDQHDDTVIALALAWRAAKNYYAELTPPPPASEPDDELRDKIRRQMAADDEEGGHEVSAGW